MSVLMVHNRYLQRGGEDVAFENDLRLLRGRDHRVEVYEISNQGLRGMNPLRAFARALWSFESAREISVLLRSRRPDIMHVYNTFPMISPAVLHLAARSGIPVVQQLSNYRLLCPNALFMRSGQVCEDCMGRFLPWPSILHACYRQSRAATAAAALMLAVHRGLKTWKRNVSRFVAVSEFARRKFIEGGFDGDKISVRTDFVGRDPGTGAGPRSGGMFAGMMLPWKGLEVLVRAWRLCPDAGMLRIAGSGPDEARLRAIAAGDKRVQFMGFMHADQMLAAMQKASFAVFPSLVYETFGRTIIEAFACGTPVIASRLGSAEQIVRDGKTGLHFRSGDAADLAAKIRWAVSHPEALARMGRAAREEYETRYTAEVAYQRLMDIYAQAKRGLAGM